jgi:hypothetical protein
MVWIVLAIIIAALIIERAIVKAHNGRIEYEESVRRSEMNEKQGNEFDPLKPIYPGE